MGWQDRDYNRQINYGGTPFSNPILNLLMGSLPLGTWFGIRVRIHASLFWLIAFRIFTAGKVGWVDVIAYSAMLFFIVLLHEFGHCLGARMVGGDARDILLWPLGGLAYTDTARRPWPRFVTVACGPLVNVLLIPVLGGLFYFYYQAAPPLNPFFTWSTSAQLAYFSSHTLVERVAGSAIGDWIWWAYNINWMLLIFNLIPMYPLDGGKLFQILLWKPLGYAKSMYISCIVGMFGAVVLAGVSILQSSFFTIILAIFGFMDCLMQLRILRETQAEGDDEPYDLSAAWENPDKPSPRRKKLKKRWVRWARKKASRDQAEQAKIDAILAKVKEKGLHSLTWWEKRTLKKATERQRQRDLANRF